MKKIVLAVGSALVLFSCAVQNPQKVYESSLKSISADNLKRDLYIIASDEMQGRDTGSPGQKKAGEYMIGQYKKMGVGHPPSMNSYYQKVPSEYMSKRKKINDSENILAYIEGSEKPNEIIVVSAHYDHVGMNNGQIYNGADDDGSGTVGVMAIAEAFHKAKKAGHGPKRSILFLHVTGEEKGLFGSSYYSDNPIFPLANTVANLNIDMIGRVDPLHKDNPNFVYVVGSEMLSSQLKEAVEKANKATHNLYLDYKYDDPKDPDRIYYRSDHYNFAKHNIPIAFFFDGIHEDYHKPTDTPDKIDYPLLMKRTQLVFTIAWDLANRPDRIVVDKK
ncbi:M28 family peptidase [Elizabethkingia meningoseptica]|uniref:Peptidase M28 n=1 Tax=Elizabethkingia meningoseptica TaxID=238 RepID=A0A1V3U3D3_ELIME|nr:MULTISPECIES: M28 family metallopeptidase [Elizabethkingia]AQX05203.1 peptidase M28 [Elizabethkingia meningoseptica]AQX12778.1 peptidase M28 [Elizabethkingia meningoseptica]AQX47247.1 peptidase M28 [Elizabethkingia meningoseptica]EJK5329775.1 M28 family peptidase [Elizabethkingia meningoseptica]EOR29103.1 aminopeptidase [Elizabethkingia meningoseptica ATCC 13253 = NBRC 12535]